MDDTKEPKAWYVGSNAGDDTMMPFKDEVVNRLSQEERFDLITEGYLREPVYDFGTELVIDDDGDQNLKYECEYLTKECSLKNARMLWCWSLKTNTFVVLPEDPLFSGELDEEYQTEASTDPYSYLKLKQDIADGNYPEDLSTLTSPEELKLLMPKFLKDGLITFDRETGSYNISEKLQKIIGKRDIWEI